MRILTFSSLFPNRNQPSHGIFVENRLRHLLAGGGIEARVVAPIPWVPPGVKLPAEYAPYAGVPAAETRHGIEILHPRYLVLPKIGMSAAPYLMYAGVRRAVARLLAQGYDFDLIDAHYFYPDGVAAIWLGRAFGKPVTITGRGTDLNLIPQYAWPRRLIQMAAREAAGMITVCAALKEPLLELGADADRVRVLRNGVDLKMFQPMERAPLRAKLGLTRPTLASVGHLITRKGHDIVIKAMRLLPDMDLLIAGDGPEDAALRALAASEGMGDRVRFLGRLGHAALREVYAASDILILASSREGWANVLLEAMACGTPVVASNVWGTPEVVAAPEAGALMAARTPEALAASVAQVRARAIDRAATRAYAEQFSWDDTTRGQLDLFRAILARGNAA
jgi:teichuronic acid biosynthesis glycosyltransferase TuaC